MTALDLIREGFGVWADGSSANYFRATPIMFALLFLFGFLATGIIRTFKIPRAIVADTSDLLSDEGREIIDDANTARLFELESELSASKDALSRFTETLSTTFANMSDGLAIFDEDKSLFLFNPALSDQLDLDPVWLARRPSISDFIGMLRENRHLPEKRNFLAWRRLLTGLQDTGRQEIYNEEWALPDGRTFRVTGQPHPRGAVAFLFEDISESVVKDRQHHLERIMYKGILNELSDAVVIVQTSGLAKFANTKFFELFGEGICGILKNQGFAGLANSTEIGSEDSAFWSKVKTQISATGNPAPWNQRLTDQKGIGLLANVSALPDGSILVKIAMSAKVASKTVHTPKAPSKTPDPLDLYNLENMLRQRRISLDQSGFDTNCAEADGTAKLRRIIWYLVINASDNCRAGVQIALSSAVEGQFTRISCSVSTEERLDDTQESIAASLLKQLVEQPDTKNIWNYNIEVDPFSVSFKSQLPLKLSAV